MSKGFLRWALDILIVLVTGASSYLALQTIAHGQDIAVMKSQVERAEKDRGETLDEIRSLRQEMNIRFDKVDAKLEKK